MSASLSGEFNLQAFTDLGDPLIGGRLYTYNFGTTTHKTAYTDHAGTIPHTYTNDGLGGQYIALNARGELSAPLYLVGGSYDLSLKRADGSTLWTRRADPVWDITNDLSSDGGAALIGFAPTGTGAVPTTVQKKLREHPSAEERGIVTTDTTGAANTTAFNLAATELPAGARLEFTQGTYLLNDAFNKRLELSALGRGVTLKAGTGATNILSLGRHVPDWRYHKVEGFTFDGNGKQADGIDFNDNVAGAEHFGGRWILEQCDFTGCKSGVYARSGNIGNVYNYCNFSDSDYGLRLTTEQPASQVMHAGCTTVNGGHFDSCAKAAIYINDSVDGHGQYDFNNVVLELNPGFGVFINGRNLVNYAGITFKNLWLEVNATAPTVNIDGTNYTPRDIYLKDVKPVLFEGTYLKSVELVNSVLLAKNCRIDRAAGYLDLIVDAQSSLICEDLLMGTGGFSPVPYVKSIAASYGKSGSQNYSVRGPLKTNRVNPGPGVTLYKENFDGAGPWAFTGTSSVDAVSVADGVISGTCAQLTIPAGYTVLAPFFGTPTVGKWAVWGGHLKLVGGAEMSTSGFSNNYTLGDLYQRPQEWVCSYGIQQIGGTTGVNRPLFTNSSGDTITIRLADFFVVEFTNEADALAFCNSGCAVR